MNKKEISLVLGTMCALLLFAISIQLKTIEKANTIASQTFVEDTLRDEVLRAKDKYDRLYSDVEKEEEALEEIRGKVSENDSVLGELETKIKNAKTMLGLTELKGQGIQIILDDNKTVSSESLGALEDLSAYIVHYIDVLNIINELRNAGAEAISVNGQRITSATAIACIGNVISINGERVGAPFEIKAIGNPEMLYGALVRTGGYIEILGKYGVVKEVKKSNELTIPKYSGRFTAEYMRNY